MRYAVSGHNTVAGDTSAGSTQLLLGATVTPGRVFWLTGAWITGNRNLATTARFNFYDCTAGACAASLTPAAVYWQATWGGAGLGSGVIQKFPAPGVKFDTGVCFCHSGCQAVNIGAAGGCGYEEA